VVPVRAYDSDSFTNSENQNERDKKVAIVFYMATSPQNKDLALRLLFTDCKRACKRDLGAPNRIKAIGLGTFFKTSAEFWMKLQMTYDLRYAEKALPARVRKSIEDNSSVLT